jgi:hypothetical protein
LLERRALGAQINASVVLILITKTLDRRGLVREHYPVGKVLVIALLFKVNFSLKNVMNVSLLVLSHHASVVIVGARHSSVGVLNLDFQMIVWVILEASSDWRKKLLDTLVGLGTSFSLVVVLN